MSSFDEAEMEGDESSDVFEISDFSCASPWEKFISSLEDCLRKWTASSESHECLSQLIETEGLSYNFSLNRYNKGARNAGETAANDVLSFDAFLDNSEDVHTIHKWFGVREFLLLVPTSRDEWFDRSDVSVLLSAISLACDHSKKFFPCFVPVGNPQDNLYAGLSSLGHSDPRSRAALRFDVEKARDVPPLYTHLSGLLDLFSIKMGLLQSSVQRHISISAKVTHEIDRFADTEWRALMFNENDSIPHYLLEWGTEQDPVQRISVSFTWPSFSETSLVDNAVFSQLDASSAPLSFASMEHAKRIECVMTSSLRSLFYLLQDSLEQQKPQFQSPESNSPPFPSPEHSTTNLTTSVVNFVKGTELGGRLISAGRRVVVNRRVRAAVASREEMSNIVRGLFMAKGAEDLSIPKWMPKAAPTGSLLSLLSLQAIILDDENAIADLWSEFVRYLRWSWESQRLVPNVPTGQPDWRTSIVLQKLQMLNLCIEKSLQSTGNTHSAASTTPIGVSSSTTPLFENSASASALDTSAGWDHDLEFDDEEEDQIEVENPKPESQPEIPKLENLALVEIQPEPEPENGDNNQSMMSITEEENENENQAENPKPESQPENEIRKPELEIEIPKPEASGSGSASQESDRASLMSESDEEGDVFYEIEEEAEQRAEIVGTIITPTPIIQSPTPLCSAPPPIGIISATSPAGENENENEQEDQLPVDVSDIDVNVLESTTEQQNQRHEEPQQQPQGEEEDQRKSDKSSPLSDIETPIVSPPAEENPAISAPAPTIPKENSAPTPLVPEGLKGQGVASVVPNMSLSNGEPFCIPIVQEDVPQTEDMALQQQEVLFGLGTSQEATYVRARILGARLASDMQAFKAANPGCILEDFLRWYSPKDLQHEAEGGSGVSAMGGTTQLSARMNKDGNLWKQLWETAQPVTASQQKPLFDCIREAELLLHSLESMPPQQYLNEFLMCAFVIAYDTLESIPATRLPLMAPYLDRIKRALGRLSPDSPNRIQEASDLCVAFEEAEAVTSLCTSLLHRFVEPESLVTSLCEGSSYLEDEGERKSVLEAMGSSIKESSPSIKEFVLSCGSPDQSRPDVCRMYARLSPSDFHLGVVSTSHYY